LFFFRIKFPDGVSNCTHEYVHESSTGLKSVKLFAQDQNDANLKALLKKKIV